LGKKTKIPPKNTREWGANQKTKNHHNGPKRSRVPLGFFDGAGAKKARNCPIWKPARGRRAWIAKVLFSSPKKNGKKKKKKKKKKKTKKVFHDL